MLLISFKLPISVQNMHLKSNLKSMLKYLSLPSLSDKFIGDFCGLHYIFMEFPELL